MSFSLTPNFLARSSARHPWRAISAWGLLFVVSIMLTGALLSGVLTTTIRATNNPDSEQALTLLEDRLRGGKKANEALIVRSETLTVGDAAFRTEVEALYASVMVLGPDIIQAATTFYESQNPVLVSQDGRATIIPIVMAGSLDTADENIGRVLGIVEAANGTGSFEVYVSGTASIAHDFLTAGKEGLMRGEMIGGGLALIILLIVFGALIAAVVPLVIAIAAIVAALAMTALLGQEFEFSFVVTNIVVMMGLAVGIDYALFILSRFREERERGRAVLDAVEVASSTAGRAVFFSGLTVIIALMGMLIVPNTIFRSIAMGAVFVVSFAVLASLTLLPALMSLLGDRVNSLRVPLMEGGQRQLGEERRGGLWDQLATMVMRHPVLGVVSVTVLLIAAAVPVLDLNPGVAGVSTLPENFQSRQGFEILERDFQGGQVTPAEVVIDGDAHSSEVAAAIERLKGSLAADAVFGPASYVTNDAGDLGLLAVQVAIDPDLEAARNGIKRLRADYIPQAFEGVPVEVLVTGQTAVALDGMEIMSDYTPIVFAFVLGLSFLLLMLVFRSIVVPLKAILMNLLSVGAAYGLIVLVSQKGVGADILGFQQVDTVQFFLPLFLFSILFGLSMDYHVFLLSRIRERYDQTGDNTESVAYGLRSTGRLITGAALIMVAVFSGFAMADVVALQQTGFGLGIAVLIDATIIRCILVPASMRLLGKWNWYLPSWLQWIPNVVMSEGVPEAYRRTAPAAAARPVSERVSGPILVPMDD